DASDLGLGFDAAQRDRSAGISKLDRLMRRLAKFVLHRDVGRVVDHALNEILLETLHQRGDRDEEADAHGDAEHRDDRLALPRAEMRERNVELEVHRPRASGFAAAAPSAAGPTMRALTKSPSFKVCGGSVTTSSVSLIPSRISAFVVPRMPTLTARLRARA